MSLLCLLLFGVGCFGTGVTTFADAFVIAGGYFHGGGDFNGGWDFHGRLDVGGGLGGNFHVEGGGTSTVVLRWQVALVAV